MKYTNEQLMLAAAKMLPEELSISINDKIIKWRKAKGNIVWRPVQETEMLHVAWLIEQTLDQEGRIRFMCELLNIIWNRTNISHRTIDLVDASKICHASWQQRIEALATIKKLGDGYETD